MIDRGLATAGIALAVMGPALPFMFPKLSKGSAWGIFSSGLLLLAAAGGLLLLPVDAQTSTPGPGNITAPNNTGIITNGQSGGTNTVIQGPPRLPLGLYQSDQQIGLVDGSSVSADGKQITLNNPRTASGTVNFAANIELGDHLVLACPSLAPSRPAAFSAVSTVGRVTCTVVGNR